MNVTERTETELVASESTIWGTLLFLAIAALCLYAALTSADKRLLSPCVVFLLFALLCARTSTFVFNRIERIARWRKFRFIWFSSGTIPFDEIKGVGMQTSLSGRGRTNYRLTLLTPDGAVPLTEGYGLPQERYDQAREKIETFLLGKAKLEDFEASVRDLLQQGRKMDAIMLVRQRQRCDMEEAARKVQEIEKS
jgi:hypothetical protein